MAAPEGNQFWRLRTKHGVEALFTESDKLWEAACEYFDWAENNPLIEQEQRKGAIVIQKGADASDIDMNPVVELPKMRAFTIQGLTRHLGVNTRYFDDFKRSETAKTKDFPSVLTRIMDVIYEQKFTGAAAGFLNPNIIARDLGLADKKDIDKRVTKLNFKDAE